MSEWNGNRNGPRDWTLVERFLLAELDDRRRAKRWRRVRFLLIVALIGVFGWGLLREQGMGTASFGAHTAVVMLEGEIADGAPANAASLIDSLDAAFENVESKAVVLAINSPGGSPVQADEVYREIRRLRVKYPAKPLYAVISDMGASGAYYVAVAADRIYVNPSSLVGSIGVIMPGYGVPTLLQKLGVEDRTLTAGAHKNLLSPTRPINPVEREHVQSVLDAVHRQFIAAVKAGRGKRLGQDPDLFSGYFWSGEQAVALGLADGVGSVRSVARDVIKEDNLVDYTIAPNPLDVALRKLGAELGLALRQGLGLAAPAAVLR